MVINFKLIHTNYLRHNEIITLPEDKVELSFTKTHLSVGELVLSVMKGTKVKQYKVKDDPVDITEFTEAGEVNACVSLTVRGEVARTWQIEPFCAREIPAGIEVVPEVEKIKEDVAVIKQAITEIHKYIFEEN